MRRTGDYHLSSDILQESFTRYFERYGNKQHSLSLLYTIGRNLIFDAARKQARITELQMDTGTVSLSLIHISEPTRPPVASRMPSSA